MKILIIKFAAIGDLLKATPALRALRKQFPGAEINLMVGEWSYPVVRHNPNIDRFFVFPDRDFFGRNPVGVFHAWWTLRRTSWDKVFVMHRALPWMILTRFLRVRDRYGFGGIDAPLKHHIRRYLEMVARAGARSDGEQMELHWEKEDEVKADNLWQTLSLQSDTIPIAMAVGGARNPKETKLEKQYPIEKYKTVISELLQNPQVAILLVGNAEDHGLAEKMTSLNPRRVQNICGKTTVLECAALLKRVRLFISHDTGLLQVAAAVGTPTLSLFGPTLPEEQAPIGDKHAIIQSPQAREWYGNRQGDFLTPPSNIQLMDAISPQSVADAALKLLSPVPH